MDLAHMPRQGPLKRKTNTRKQSGQMATPMYVLTKLICITYSVIMTNTCIVTWFFCAICYPDSGCKYSSYSIHCPALVDKNVRKNVRTSTCEYSILPQSLLWRNTWPNTMPLDAPCITNNSLKHEYIISIVTNNCLVVAGFFLFSTNWVNMRLTTLNETTIRGTTIEEDISFSYLQQTITGKLFSISPWIKLEANDLLK